MTENETGVKVTYLLVSASPNYNSRAKYFVRITQFAWIVGNGFQIATASCQSLDRTIFCCNKASDEETAAIRVPKSLGGNPGVKPA